MRSPRTPPAAQLVVRRNGGVGFRVQALSVGACLQVVLALFQVVPLGASAQAPGWTPMNPPFSPSVRAAHDLSYDERSDRTILFGGLDGSLQVLGDTWAYDFDPNTWTNRNPTIAPSPRLGHRMAYDARSDRVILLGGHRGRDPSAVFLDDTWSYDFNANVWSERAPAIHPEGGNHGGLVYHEQSDRVILFGGDEATGPKRATWAYDVDGNRWTELRPAAAPTARFLVGMAYDAASNRVVLFGGTSGATETWICHVEGNQWTRLDLPSAPSGRNGHRMAYDRQSDRTILFGGGDGLPGTVNNETWAFDLEVPQEFPWLPAIVAAIVGTSAAAAAVLLIRRRGRRRTSESKGL